MGKGRWREREGERGEAGTTHESKLEFQPDGLRIAHDSFCCFDLEGVGS